MQSYVVLAADGMTPARVSSQPISGAVAIDGDFAAIDGRVFVGGAWVLPTALSEPEISESVAGRRISFTGLPAGTRVLVINATLALAVMQAVVNDGELSILLASIGTYDVEIVPPAPWQRWERRIAWT